jgi:glycosyltransferase involved in cell wall biosynthesis
VERWIVNTAWGLSRLDVRIDMLLRLSEDNVFLRQIPSQVHLQPLPDGGRAALAKSLKEYLLRSPPQALLTFRSKDYQTVLAARRRYAPDAKVILVTGAMVSRRQERKRVGFFNALKQRIRIRRSWAKADRVICISPEIAEDWENSTPFTSNRLLVPPNPIITPTMLELATHPAPHPWLKQRDCPVLLGAGRLGPQKNFSLLLDAFALVRKQRECRLIILGKGEQQRQLKQQAVSLGIAEAVSFPGFSDNPYAYMASADLFVLSSAWEPYGIVLIEALALGTPVVSTDCPIGPGGILKHGALGRLVPPGDPAALSSAILETLTQSVDAEFLRRSVSEHSLENSAGAYLKIIQDCIDG